METLILTNTFNATTSHYYEANPSELSIITTTVGPKFARQWMRFNNQTVVSKVPEEMLHLIDTYW